MKYNCVLHDKRTLTEVVPVLKVFPQNFWATLKLATQTLDIEGGKEIVVLK